MINPAIEEDLKRMSLNDVNYADYIKENYVPIEVLQEIRAEIEAIIGEHNLDDYDFCSGLICARKIIDKYISALNNDQFERIWNHTVEEMKRRKICEDILEEAEEWDSETMSGSLLTGDDLRLLINDVMDKVTQ